MDIETFKKAIENNKSLKKAIELCVKAIIESDRKLLTGQSIENKGKKS